MDLCNYFGDLRVDVLRHRKIMMLSCDGLSPARAAFAFWTVPSTDVILELVNRCHISYIFWEGVPYCGCLVSKTLYTIPSGSSRWYMYCPLVSKIVMILLDL